MISYEAYAKVVEDGEDQARECGILQVKNKKLEKENSELKEFCIWMTGCGYDFCQHEYFIEKRDSLLKDSGKSDECEQKQT